MVRGHVVIVGRSGAGGNAAACVQCTRAAALYNITGPTMQLMVLRCARVAVLIYSLQRWRRRWRWQQRPRPRENIYSRNALVCVRELRYQPARVLVCVRLYVLIMCVFVCVCMKLAWMDHS